MAITQTISAMPSAPVRTQTQTVFDAAMAAVLAAWPTNITEMNSMASQMNTLAASMNAIAAGTAMAIPLKFDTATSDVDPGNGYLRLDNATQNAATTIRLDLVGSDGSDWSAVEGQFTSSTSTVKGHIALEKAGDATKFLIFAVTGMASPSGYKNVTVTNVASSSANPFALNDPLILKFTRTGDKGDAGAAGPSFGARSPRTSNTILGTADAGKWIDSTSGTYTQTLTAAATLGASWSVLIGNSSTAATPDYVTYDPNGSETLTVNGVALTTYVLWPGEMGILSCDGSGFFYQQLKGGQIKQTVGVAVGSVSFSTGMSYRRRLSLSIEDVVMNSASDNLNLKINGGNWDNAESISEAATAGVGSASMGTVAGLDGTAGIQGSATAANRLYSDVDIRVGTVGTQASWVTHLKNTVPRYVAVWGTAEKSSVNETNLSSISIAAANSTITGGTFILKEIN